MNKGHRIGGVVIDEVQTFKRWGMMKTGKAKAPQQQLTRDELRAWAREQAVPGRSIMKVERLRELHALWLKAQRRTQKRYLGNEKRELHYKKQCGKIRPGRQARRIKKKSWREVQSEQ